MKTRDLAISFETFLDAKNFSETLQAYGLSTQVGQPLALEGGLQNFAKGLFMRLSSLQHGVTRLVEPGDRVVNRATYAPINSADDDFYDEDEDVTIVNPNSEPSENRIILQQGTATTLVGDFDLVDTVTVI